MVILGLLCAIAAPAATLYWGGGVTDIPNGTPLTTDIRQLTGAWSTTTNNWSADPTGTTYVAWSNSGTNNEAYIGYGLTLTNKDNVHCTLTLAESMALNRLSGRLITPTYAHTIYFTAASAVSLTLNGPAPVIWGSADDYRYDYLSFEPNVRLTGTNGFSQRGTIRVAVKSDGSGLTGPVTLEAGNLYVLGGGKLPGVESFEIRGTAYGENDGLWVYPNTAGARNDLGDACVVRLKGGTFEYRGYRNATAPSIETIGAIVLDSVGHLNPADATGTGALKGKLYLAIDRGPNGKGTMNIGKHRGALDFNTDVILSGYPTGTILPWMSHCRGYAMQLTADNVVTNLPMANAPLDVAAWAPDSDYRVFPAATEDMSGTLGDLTIRSLGALLYNSETLTIGASNVLTVTSGYIGVGWDSGVGGFGADTLTFAGGRLTTTSDDLYLHSAQTLGYITVSSVIGGAVNVVTAGRSLVTLAGTAPNVHTGVTFVQGPCSLGKSDNVIAVPGNLDVGGFGTVTVNADQQIRGSATVVIRRGGTLAFGASDAQTFSNAVTNDGGTIRAYNDNLVFNAPGVGLAFNGGSFTDTSTSGDIRLLTDVSYAATARTQAVFSDTAGEVIQLAFGAGAVTRTFDVADSGTLTAGVPEMVAAMPFTQSTGTAGLRKTGSGVLAMSAAHLYSGGTTIEGGRLLANSASGSATGSGPVIVTNSATLGGSGTVAGAVTVYGGATIDPGGAPDATGTLSLGNGLSVAAGGAVHVDLASGANDLLNVLGGDLTVSGTVTPALLDGYTPLANTKWTIAVVAAPGTISIAGASVAPGYSLFIQGQSLILSNPAAGTTLLVR